LSQRCAFLSSGLTTPTMFKDVNSLLEPKSVAIVGASAKRVSQGNLVIANLLAADFQKPIVPIHPTAEAIDGLRSISSPDELAVDVDLAVLAIPASGVTDTLRQLQRNRVRSAIVFANGFTTAEEQDLRKFLDASDMVVHGPNCMGLINVNDQVSLYPTRPSERLKAGGVALLAQSGSAAISVMNSAVAGFSKVVTMGSEFQVTAADYIHWLAGDEHTTVIGVVTEGIADPVAFAEATALAHAAGKSVIVLNVGTSAVGAAAAQAHTGALISNQDACDRFFIECDIAIARDFDELIASLECLAYQHRSAPGAGGLAVVGISGGQTALACDIAERSSVPLAKFADSTSEVIKRCLPGSAGSNPIDIGATLDIDRKALPQALDTVVNDESVTGLAFIQDAQDSLNPRSLDSYQSILKTYVDAAESSSKPVVLISPTGQNLHNTVTSQFADKGIPTLRGLNAGMAALGNMAKGNPELARQWINTRTTHRQADAIQQTTAGWRFDEESGLLDPQSSAELMAQYAIPHVASIVVENKHEAIARADEIGFPMVAKVVSTDIPHRSEAGGVTTGITDRGTLEESIEAIAANIIARSPQASIQGFELQQDLSDHIEVMVGFTQSPPFGSLIVVGTGGTMVELESDRALRLAPFGAEDAGKMIASTRVGKLLSGYRRLIPETDIGPLSQLVSRFSLMADDCRHSLAACDLNPVMVQKESGQVCTVDTLFVVNREISDPTKTVGGTKG
ncbi:MAG: acetate--CoA ligase family protein, partial [Woeseiaceae bacterium]